MQQVTKEIIRIGMLVRFPPNAISYCALGRRIRTKIATNRKRVTWKAKKEEMFFVSRNQNQPHSLSIADLLPKPNWNHMNKSSQTLKTLLRRASESNLKYMPLYLKSAIACKQRVVCHIITI